MTQYIVLPACFEHGIRAHSEKFEIIQVDIPEHDTPPVFEDKQKALDLQIHLMDEWKPLYGSYEIFEFLLITDLNFYDDKKEAIAKWLREYTSCILAPYELDTSLTVEGFKKDAKELFDLIMSDQESTRE